MDVSGQLDFKGTRRVTEFILSANQPIMVQLSLTWRSMVRDICAKRVGKLESNG
jgi:hypothetical protein